MKQLLILRFDKPLAAVEQFALKHEHGLLSRTAVLSKPFASRGVAGVQILSPGTFA